VVCGWPLLALAAICDLRGAPHAGATYSPIDATVIIGRGPWRPPRRLGWERSPATV
jgi:hypothetical protein